MAVSPRSSVKERQTSGSYPTSVSISRRTAMLGDLFSRNRRTTDRNSCCSSVKLNRIGRAPQMAARRDLHASYLAGLYANSRHSAMTDPTVCKSAIVRGRFAETTAHAVCASRAGERLLPLRGHAHASGSPVVAASVFITGQNAATKALGLLPGRTLANSQAM